MQPSALFQAQFSAPRLVRATGVTLAAAVVSVVIIRAIAVNVVTVPQAFEPLKVASAVSLTVFGVLGAAGICLLLNRFAREPIWTFQRLVPILLPVTFVPDILIWVTHAYGRTADASTVIPLMLMHIAVALLCVRMLPRLGRDAPVGTVAIAT